MSIKTICLLIGLALCVDACVAALPDAINYEQQNQRKIAHHTGWVEYQQFVENNK